LLKDLNDFEEFKDGLSLFDITKPNKVRNMVDKFKKASQNKEKLTDEERKDIANIAKIDLDSFEFDDDSVYNKVSLENIVIKEDEFSIKTEDRGNKESFIRESLVDWEDRVSGAKKSKTVPLMMRCFAM
jgi:hypothetical protein